MTSKANPALPAVREPRWLVDVIRPTLIVSQARCRKNIETMAGKAAASGIRFRPHFKTHQSAVIGEWFRQAGVQAITVSSLKMAEAFAEGGWNDITVAFPCNLREIRLINQLAENIRLGLLVESLPTVELLQKQLAAVVDVWIKIDVGSQRTGITWADTAAIVSLAKSIRASARTRLRGILAHSGHTYGAAGSGEIIRIFRETVERLQKVRAGLSSAGVEDVEISVGDTPGCSLVSDFKGVDEIRPGNFVYYDLMQLSIGSCGWEQIAAVVACPVVAKHPERGELVIYGGAVHLSKESLTDEHGQPIYGRVAMPTDAGWGQPLGGTCVARISQEHGIIRTTSEVVAKVGVGDVLLVAPVHSCLAADLLGEPQII